MTEPPVSTTDSFVARLGHLLLVAFAAGQSVNGEYDLSTETVMIPRIRVSILREGPGGDSRPDESTVELDHEDFGTALETFLLSEYARGVRMEGVWTVRYARPSLPEWSVDVEVADPATGGEDDSAPPETPGAPNSGQSE